MPDVVQREQTVNTLKVMPIERFDAFLEASARSQVSDNVASGRWSAQDAAQRARSELNGLLPQGLATPGHHVYEIMGAENGPVVGFIWFGSMPRGSATVAFVFQLFIYPMHRRQGLARAALLEVEALARGLGFPAIALNVSGSNTSAQALYRSLGYAVMHMSMNKPLEPSQLA